MKYIYILLYFFLVFLIFSNCSHKDAPPPETNHNPLFGSWELEKVEFMFPDTTLVWDSSMFHSTYFVGDNHFNFIYSNKERDELMYAGFGRYTLAEDKYIEHVEFHSVKYIIGTSVIFDNTVEGDTWIHEGYIPSREEDSLFFNLSHGSPTIHMREVRRRME